MDAVSGGATASRLTRCKPANISNGQWIEAIRTAKCVMGIALRLGRASRLICARQFSITGSLRIKAILFVNALLVFVLNMAMAF
jgi:hypothetical protein